MATSRSRRICHPVRVQRRLIEWIEPESEDASYGLEDYAHRFIKIGDNLIPIPLADSRPLTREWLAKWPEEVLEESLREEEEMAAWLARHLPKVTCQYLHREAAGQSAKV
jgi:hypothetical protein